MILKIFTDEIFTRIMAWIVVSLMAVSTSLVVYFWQQMMNRLKSIESMVHQHLTASAGLTVKISENQKDIDTLFNKNRDMSKDISSIDKRLAVLESKS